MRTALLFAFSAILASAASPAGRWQCLLPASDHSLRPFIFSLKVNDFAITGFIKGEIYDGVPSPDIAVSDAKTEGEHLTFFAKMPGHASVRLTRYSGTFTSPTSLDLVIARVDGRRPPVSCTASRVGD